MIVVLILILVWLIAYGIAVVHDSRMLGLSIRHTIADTGQPMLYVHTLYGECSRPWCYCHSSES